MPATNQKQTEPRYTSTPPTAPAKQIQTNAAESDQRAAPKSDAPKTLKAFLAHKYTVIVEYSINVVGCLYCQWMLIEFYSRRSLERPNEKS